MRVYGVIFLLFGLLLAPAVLSAADSPQATIQSAITRVMAIIDDTSLTGEAGQAEKVKRIKVIVDEVFDYPKLSRQSLGKNWNRITPAEQEEFTSLFSQFLGQVYISKITSFPGSKVEFGGEVPLSDTVREVRTTVQTREANVPINYRLTTTDKGWKVYDVTVEGVSLLNNYRSQFHSILSNKPMEHLLVQLRAKVASYGS
jgi:phospholipid transport system substrate-binding protein